MFIQIFSGETKRTVVTSNVPPVSMMWIALEADIALDSPVSREAGEAEETDTDTEDEP